MNKSTLMIVCGLVGAVCMWLATHVPQAQGQAQAVVDINRPVDARFVVKTWRLEDPVTWTAFKMDRITGRTWRLDNRSWTPIREAGSMPNGNYDLQVMVAGVMGYVCIRQETNTGRVWTTHNSLTWEGALANIQGYSDDKNVVRKTLSDTAGKDWTLAENEWVETH